MLNPATASPQSPKRSKGNTMLVPTIIMAVLACSLFIAAVAKGGGQHIVGLKAALRMTVELLPMLVLAFIVAGMMQTLVPQQHISQWIGAESGLRGILLGTLVGAITPGGPFVSMPLAAGFLKAGAGMGTMVAFMTSWSLLSVHRIPIELSVLGWRFLLVRMASTALFAPLAGIFANAIVKALKI